MQFSLSSDALNTLSTDCLVVGIFTDNQLSEGAQNVDELCDGGIQNALKLGDFSGAVSSTQFLYDLPNLKTQRVLLVGCGNEEKLTLQQYHQIVQTAALTLQKSAAEHITSLLHTIIPNGKDSAWCVQSISSNVINGLYRFDEHKPSQKAVKQPIHTWAHWVDKSNESLQNAMTQGEALGKGMSLTRDLGNQPGNVATPKFLSKQAKELDKNYKGIKTSVIDESELEKMGAGAFVSVAKGSSESGKLIVMEYMQGKKGDKPIVLVGKGITFDTGGISLKPGAGMDEMKYDMCGAASVFGTLKTLAEMNAKVNVVGLVAAAENMPAGNASKPGDIVTTLSGQTVEILNTDAEGRLVLCDTLTYAKRFDPKVVIDIATLTGACIIALGKIPSAMMSNDEALASELNQAADISGDRIWRLPIWDDYQKQLDSNFADMQNIGGREAGSITAACFLSRFTKDYRWAHLDIAGTAWVSDAKKGATGRPVPLLVEYVLQQNT